MLHPAIVNEPLPASTGTLRHRSVYSGDRHTIQKLGENSMETTDTRHRSRTILEGRDRAPARSFLKGMGYSEEDISKPMVGVAHSWIETMPCNYNHRHLAEKVKDGIR